MDSPPFLIGRDGGFLQPSSSSLPQHARRRDDLWLPSSLELGRGRHPPKPALTRRSVNEGLTEGRTAVLTPHRLEAGLVFAAVATGFLEAPTAIFLTQTRDAAILPVTADPMRVTHPIATEQALTVRPRTALPNVAQVASERVAGLPFHRRLNIKSALLEIHDSTRDSAPLPPGEKSPVDGTAGFVLISRVEGCRDYQPPKGGPRQKGFEVWERRLSAGVHGRVGATNAEPALARKDSRRKSQKFNARTPS